MHVDARSSTPESVLQGAPNEVKPKTDTKKSNEKEYRMANQKNVCNKTFQFVSVYSLKLNELPQEHLTPPHSHTMVRQPVENNCGLFSTVTKYT